MKEAVILVGHGSAPSDFPKDKLARLKRLEAERAAKGLLDMGEEEAILDAEVRRYPRTAKTDPYQAGLLSLAQKLEEAAGLKVVAAYNEFCAPDVKSAAKGLINEGYGRIVLATTMYTRGGIHSESEIPILAQRLRQEHPRVDIIYAWPMGEDLIVEFLQKAIARARAGARQA